MRGDPYAADRPFEMEEPADKRGHRSTADTRYLATIQNVFWICFRIYNNLPEVRKKKEEQKKRVILQSNRLRAEVFKKVMARPPAGVTCVWCPDADSELDFFVSNSLAITGPAPSKERSLTTGCPADPLPGPGMTSNAG